MADYRSMYDDRFVGAWHLEGKEVTVTIAKVSADTIVGDKGRKSKKPMITFRGTDKGLFCNKTNGKIIAGMYGTDTEKWIGKRLTLFPTTTTCGTETVPCVRVRPTIPKSGGADGRINADAAPPERPADSTHAPSAGREPGDE